MPKPPLKPTISLWFEAWGEKIVGEDLVRLLEGVRATGSLIAACRTLGVSYAHAWEKIDRVQRVLEEPILEAKRGGEGGGGCKLTEAGLRILESYRMLEGRLEDLLASEAGGSRLRRRLFLSRKPLPDLAVVGSHCVGVETLLRLLTSNFRHAKVEAAYVGSAGGLAAIMLGEADVAGVHLLDEETGQYNLPFLKRNWIEDRAVLVRGYAREQGLIVPKGNPKEIRDLEDLLKPGVRLINREPGSGTRALLDRRLRNVASSKGVTLKALMKSIRGYGFEVRSHRDVARAVAKGRADVGLGIRAAAEEFGLDFVPLAEELFDFVVEERRLTKPLVASFLRLLGSKEFKEELEFRARGIRVLPETGRMLYRP